MLGVGVPGEGDARRSVLPRSSYEYLRMSGRTRRLALRINPPARPRHPLLRYRYTVRRARCPVADEEGAVRGEGDGDGVLEAGQ